jgi:predicted nucleic acid-binding protein
VAKTFLDTNILVYTVDEHDQVRNKRARELLEMVHHSGQGVISTQVLQEFYVAVTRKLHVAPLVAKQLIDALPPMEVVAVDVSMVREAIDTSILNQISFWDALIVVAARKARCSELWTEDLNPGQSILSVTIRNPIAAKNETHVKAPGTIYRIRPRSRKRVTLP